MEVVEALSEVWEPDRVGVRLSPLGASNDISDDDTETTFGYIAEKLSLKRIVSATVGTSGNCSARVLLVTASARALAVFISVIPEGTFGTSNWISPLERVASAGPPPLNGA